MAERKTRTKKREKKNVPVGRAYISSTFNNGRSQNSYLYKGQNQTGGKGLLILRGQGFGNVGSYNDEIESGYFSGTLSSVGSALCR